MKPIQTTALTALLAASGVGCATETTTTPPVEAPDPREASIYADEFYENYALYVEDSRYDSSLVGEKPQDVEIVAEVEFESPREPTPVFIDPTLRAACGMDSPTAFFPFDSTQIEDTNADLEELASCLQEYPLQGKYIEIVGHTDPRGTEEYNRELGLDRADTVAKVLQQQGVAADRIDTYSLGEYVASIEPGDWDADRKVVIQLDD